MKKIFLIASIAFSRRILKLSALFFVFYPLIGYAQCGFIKTIAGAAIVGYTGDGGPADSAKLNYPAGVAVDALGNIYIADANNNCIRKITASTGLISTVAGNGTRGYSGDGGLATSAELYDPAGVVVDNAGNIYIADVANNRIRKVTASTGRISTIAGNGTYGYSGDGGAATNAEMRYPCSVALDDSGDIYIADENNDRIRKITVSTGRISTVAGNGTYGYFGDGVQATSTGLAYPSGVAVDDSGNIYIADTYNFRIRKVNTSTGIIKTIVGNRTEGNSGDGGPADSAELSLPQSVSLDDSGNLYIADWYAEVVRKVTSSTGRIITIAGNGTEGYSGDGGPADSAELGYPQGVAVDNAGNIYIADEANNRIREVTGVPNLGIIGTTTGCGSVILIATGGSTYTWSGGSSPDSATNTFTSNGIYTVIAANNGCADTASRIVTVNPVSTATITAGGPTIFCQGDSVILSASTGSTYLWSNNATAQSINVTLSGSYTVLVVNNGANCSATSAAITVTVNPLPVATINGPVNLCSGLQATLTASGGTGYSWSNGLGSNAQVNVSPTNNTTYTVTVSNANNCSATAQQTVSVTNTPTATINGPSQVCSGNGITLTANGGNTYAWANGLGSNATINVSPTSNTTYTVTATIGANCSATASQTVTVYQPGASQYSYAMCSGQTYPFNNQNLAQGGAYYDTLQTIHGCDSIVTLNLTVNSILQTAFSDSICHGDSVMFNGHSYTSAGTYNDTLQSVTGCDSIVTLSLSIKSSGDTVNATAVHPAFCSGDSTQVCATAGFAAYNWSNTTDTTACFYTGSANTYSVTVTDVHGCTAASNSIVITTYTPSSVTITENGDTLTSTGASGYQWYFNNQLITGDTVNIIIAQHTGSYTVETTDSNGCHYNSSAVVVNTGVNDIVTGYGVKLYPNPNTGSFILEFTDDVVRDVEITDVVGRTVLAPAKVSRQQNFNVAELAAGVYILRISQGGGVQSLRFSVVR